MASAQVMPARKQGHLEAGKKRLEEFRKKKAEGRAKKVASTGQAQSAVVDINKKLSQSFEHVRDSTSTRDNSTGSFPSEMVTAHEGKAVNSRGIADSSTNDVHATSAFSNCDLALSDELQDTSKDESSKLYESSILSEPVNDYYGCSRENGELSHNKASNIEPNTRILEDDFTVSDSVGTKRNIDGHINHSSFNFGSQSRESRNSSKVNVNDHDTVSPYITSTLPERSGDALAQNMFGFPITSGSVDGVNGDAAVRVEQFIPGSMGHGNAFGGANITSHHSDVDTAVWHVPEPSATGLSLPIKSSSNQVSFPLNDSGSTIVRSRPSFLNSLGLPRVSSTSHKPYYEPPKANPPISFTDSKSQSGELSPSSTKQLYSEVNYLGQSHNMRTPDFVNERGLSTNSFVSSNDSHPPKPVVSDHSHRHEDFQTQKKDEDFAALEQFIEDLTQEKFSLQRALDTSRSLAESLASENSSLTESYNQQGQVVNQFKSDIERLQEEIKAQILALETFKLEYTNAQLECNVADERAKILASEVISLEEKALRLRSNELKLEKHLENSNSVITSYKRKVSILEKERQDFQSTIDALQEEKKLLQSKLRKTSATGKVSNSIVTSSIKRDASTTTEDLDVEQLDLVDGEASIQESTHQNTLEATFPSVVLSGDSPSGSVLPDVSGVIPNDQFRMIGNINSLVSELDLEKQELMQALAIESANSSKLKDLNKDLSRKLEAQTQKLELLTAQRMAHENVVAKPFPILHATPVYADEGDEVVERVLGWIMKLFPGGPRKGRTRKHL